MEVYDCIRSRRTVRRFKPDPVPEPVVLALLKAGRWSPSSRNQQPWRFIVVRARDTLAALGRIAGTGRYIADAPLAIAVAMEDADQPQMDAGRAIQQMELVAWSEGMGTCFVTLSSDQSRRVKELLGIPEHLELVTVLPFGYRPEDFASSGHGRRPMAEVAFAERYGAAYPSA